MKTTLITLALATTAALAGCAASGHPWPTQHQPIPGQAAAPAALSAQAPSAAGSPLYEAMLEPGAGVGYGKHAE